MLRGKAAGEHRRVGGKGERAVGVGVLEEDPVAAESVDLRGRDARVAVGGQVVGPQRVDRDEDDRGPRKRRVRAAPAAREGEARAGGGEGEVTRRIPTIHEDDHADLMNGRG
jgi:hypothetical protein